MIQSSLLRLDPSFTGNMHVGNNRFQIFAMLHLTEYTANTTTEAVSSSGSEAINKLLNHVCNPEYVNGGSRFLLKTGSVWRTLTTQQACWFICDQLDAAALQKNGVAVETSDTLKPQQQQEQQSSLVATVLLQPQNQQHCDISSPLEIATDAGDDDQ
jgi:hypothetical protein